MDYRMPVWPDYDTIVKSMNARANLRARLGDDPLLGVPITPEMITRAMQAAKG